MQTDPNDSIRIIRTALDNGINFLDNCWDYNSGESEIRMGKALRDGYRQKAFLMTKIDGRTREAAAKQIDDCLWRLQTDVIDLMQFHEIIRMNDPDRLFGPNGGYEAAMAAKKAGKIRYLGFTGHKSPEIHLKMLETCLAHNFTPVTVQIAPLGMKPMAIGYILKSGVVTPADSLHYAMNLPVAVVITGCDSLPILEQALTAARTFRPLNAQQVATLEAKTAPVYDSAKYELYNSSSHFDSTSRNPKWLGCETGFKKRRRKL